MSNGFAQTVDLKFRYFNQREGLSNTFVTSIIKDSTGYIWVGTINGLNRFNGENFKSYYDNVKDSTQLQHYYITDLFVDSKSTLWVVTQNGLHAYNRLKDNFISYGFSGLQEISETMHIDCIAENADGEIFVSVFSTIFKYDATENIFKKFIEIENGQISRFIFDSNNNIWIGAMSGGGLSYYNHNTKELTKFEIGDSSFKLPYANIQDIAIKDGMLWIASRGNGLISYDIENRIFKLHPIGLPDTDHIVDIMVDNNNQIWTIDYTGLKMYDDEKDSFYGYYYYSDDQHSIKPSPAIIYQDNQNNIWVGHNGEGLGLRVPPSGFQHVSNNKAEHWHLEHMGVNAITKDSRGNLWIANSRPGITIFNYWDWKMEQKFHREGDARGPGSGTVFTLYTDSDNSVWLGTYEGGLQKYNSEKDYFDSFTHSPGDTASIACNDIRAISEDVNGDLWIVTYSKGIDKLDKKVNKFYHFNTLNSGISNPYVNDVLGTSDGDLWAATVWGLGFMKKGSSRFENFYFNSNDSNSISSNNIFVLFEDTKKRIWVGTDNGLNLYQKEVKEFKRFNNDILKTTICGIQEDNAGNLWLSTYNGIIRLNVENNDVLLFDDIESLNNNSLIPRAQYKDSEGRIYFGGTKGITHFNPLEVSINMYPPDPVITNLYVLNHITDPNDSSSILKEHISYTKYFEVDYQDKIITFEYLGLSYNNPDENTYKYMLEGLHEDWQKPTKQTSVSFTNLSPGKYKFHVKAANNDGVWNEKEAQISFKVNPPWYKTPLFIVFLIGLVFFLIWITLNIHSLRIRRQRKLLAMQVNRKTKEFRQSNEELRTQAEYLDNLNKLLEDRQVQLEQQSKIITEKSEELEKGNVRLKELNQTKDRLFSIIAHDLISPFNTILGMTDLLMEEQDSGNKDERVKLAHNINLSTSRIFDLLQNLLFWAKSQTKEVKFRRKEFMVLRTLKESTLHFHEAIYQKKILFQLECSDDLIAYGDEDMFRTVVRNLVSNAVKFTNLNGNIKVKAINEVHQIKVIVEDDGVGISQDKLPIIFDHEALASTTGTSGEPGTGIGLFLCKELVEKNNGSIEVQSNLGKGTAFIFTIPLPKED
ncbi:two-component regulator propeller domain-containing protein [Carboxylicivirga caseinilyticus]|uniref:two-component regulator propeller domain-containing protein n=1 Tax=Carboxylicivirga caseinilyticus TaxID=3417572 RepID=UPI003D352FDE|nr:hypothetical protein [Marinilabiliaceae bacterium A049]